MKRTISSVLALACLFVAPRAAVCLTDAERDQGAYLMSGMKDAREKLRTGVFRAYNTVAADSQSHGNAKARNEVFCAFDFPRGMLRFDRNWGKEARSWLKQPDRTYESVAYRRGATIGGPDAKAPPLIKPFDVRITGLFTPHQMEYISNLEPTLEHYATKQRLASVTTEKNGVYRLTFKVGKGDIMQSSLWINEAQGFTPERIELQPIIDGVLASTPCEVIETTWAAKGGAWAPTRMTSTRTSRSSHLSESYAFEWDDVNGDKATPHLVVDDFHLPQGSPITDTRLGKRVIVEWVGMPKDLVSVALEKPDRGWLKPLFIWLNVVVVVILLAAVVYRRMRGPAMR